MPIVTFHKNGQTYQGEVKPQTNLVSHPAAAGGTTLWATTRRQSRPSNSASNCARDSRMTPS